MSDELELLYDRYNQFSYFEYTICNPNTMIKILREGAFDEAVLEEKIVEYEIKKRFQEDPSLYQEMVEDKNFVQPKSIMIRIHYFNLIIDSLPDSFFEGLDIGREMIKHITISIVMYYIGLEVYKFGPLQMHNEAYRKIIGRGDFYFTLNEFKMVCGKVTESDFEKYMGLFARDIEEIQDDSIERLYLKNGIPFVLRIVDFLDYIIYAMERTFKKSVVEEEFSRYTNLKGRAFETLAYDVIEGFFDEVYHTLYYYPKNVEKVELDIVIREKEKLAILECKSGTLWFDEAIDNAAVKGIVKNGVKKAYKSLRKVADYCAEEKEYSIHSEKGILSGIDEKPICVHVSMYPLDFISSNIHTIFPEYIQNQTNPILTISFEQLCAILLDLRRRDKNLFSYWEQRIDDIKNYPDIQFDNNELDLYYELINDDTMLSQLKKSGILNNLAPNAKIVSSFHNEYGYEERPALVMIKKLEWALQETIIDNGKKWFGINKRYLKNLKELLEIDLKINTSCDY